MGLQASSVLCCANVQDGIDYEIERERITMMIARQIADMKARGTLLSPTEADAAELRRLEVLRGNGR